MVLLAGCLLAALAGCGGSGGAENPKREAAERAFLSAMVPHHESAIEMANVARERGESPFVKKLAGDIVRDQRSEIATMRRIHERLLGQPLRPDPGAHAKLGLSAQQAGMDHMGAGAELAKARPFDRAFVDEMVPHHIGAVRMARRIAKRTRDPELRRLAQQIAAAQIKEVAAMNDFRRREYGSKVPTTGGKGGHKLGRGKAGAHGG